MSSLEEGRGECTNASSSQVWKWRLVVLHVFSFSFPFPVHVPFCSHERTDGRTNRGECMNFLEVRSEREMIVREERRGGERVVVREEVVREEGYETRSHLPLMHNQETKSPALLVYAR